MWRLCADCVRAQRLHGFNPGLANESDEANVGADNQQYFRDEQGRRALDPRSGERQTKPRQVPTTSST